MYTKHHTESENERLQTKAGQTLLVPYFFTSRRWFYVSTKIRKRYTLSNVIVCSWNYCKNIICTYSHKSRRKYNKHQHDYIHCLFSFKVLSQYSQIHIAVPFLFCILHAAAIRYRTKVSYIKKDNADRQIFCL